MSRPTPRLWSDLKVPDWRSRAYLNWVKTLSCCQCGEPADDPHHAKSQGLGGMGLTPSDCAALPLCRKCHDVIQAAPWLYPQLRWVVETMNLALAEGILIFVEEPLK